MPSKLKPVSSAPQLSPVQSSSLLPKQTKIDTRSDIYSLGVTFWYLLSGRVPFVGRTLEEIAARQAEQLPVEQLKGLDVPARVSCAVAVDVGPRSAKIARSQRANYFPQSTAATQNSAPKHVRVGDDPPWPR